MAGLRLYQPLNMFSPPKYKFMGSDQVTSGGYTADRWIMTNDLRLVVLYEPDGTVNTVGIGKPNNYYMILNGAYFEIYDRDRAKFETGRLYDYLSRALEGDDIIDASDRADAIRSFQGADTVYAGSGNDLVYGNEGSDLLIGNDGNDTLYGGEDDDQIMIGQGSDKVFGNAGSDFVLVVGPSGVTVDLQRSDMQRIGPTGRAQLSGIENVDGTEGADRLFGNEGSNIITGSSGSDAINGRRGEDTLTGGTSGDTLIGGDNFDTFVFQPGSGRDYIRDFDVGFEKIVFIDGPADFSEIKIRQDEKYAVVIYGSDWIRLDNVDAASLAANDFDFSFVVS